MKCMYRTATSIGALMALTLLVARPSTDSIRAVKRERLAKLTRSTTPRAATRALTSANTNPFTKAPLSQAEALSVVTDFTRPFIPPATEETRFIALDPQFGEGIVPGFDDLTGFVGAVGFSWDARVGVLMSNENKVISAFAARPEAITLDANGQPDFSAYMSPFKRIQRPATTTPASRAPQMYPDPAYSQNPYPSDEAGKPVVGGDHETYQAVVLSYVSNDDPAFPKISDFCTSSCIGIRNATFVVKSPLTATAEMALAQFNNAIIPLRTVSDKPLRGIEPTTSLDGRLLIFHGSPTNEGAQSHIMYSYNETPNSSVGWSDPKPLPRMFYDEQETIVAGRTFPDRYPLARKPIVAGTGEVYTPEESVRGAYPWLSQDASELTFQAVDIPNLATRSGLTIVGRLTGNQLRLVDGSLNSSRFRKQRTFGTSLGLTPGMWRARGADAEVALPFSHSKSDLPLGKYKPVYPTFSPVDGAYGEIALDDFADGNYVARYHMNEGVSKNLTFDTTRTPDTSGNLNTGLLQGAMWGQDYLGEDRNHGFEGQALYFRHSDVVRVPNSPSMNRLQGDITVECFVKRLMNLGQYGSYQRLNAVWRGSTVDGTKNQWHIEFDAAGRPWIFVHSASNPANPDNFKAQTKVPLNKWTHIAFTYSKQSGKMVLYIDGTAVATKAFTPGGIVSTGADILIGPAGLNYGSIPATGDEAVLMVDEVAISDVVRTPEEIAFSAHRPFRPKVKTTVPFEIPLGLHPSDLKVPTKSRISRESIQLGSDLFNDVKLSGSGALSCSSCHLASNAFAEAGPRKRAIRLKLGDGSSYDVARNTPSILNRAFSWVQFIDGRSPSLEHQSVQPIVSPVEMNNSMSRVLNYLNKKASYKNRFTRIYGEVSEKALGMALASFQRSLVSGNSAWDKFRSGDASALTEGQVRGLAIFEGKGRCSGCHMGNNLTDELFHNTGTAAAFEYPIVDNGRLLVTGYRQSDDGNGRLGDLNAFKTPTLRNIAKTAPYFHNGAANNLNQVVEFYNRGGRDPGGAPRDYVVDGQSAEIQKLELSTQEKRDLVDFLSALSSD